MPTRDLASRAKAARLRAGFRHPQQAADAIGCSRPLVVSWESGQAKSIGSRYLLAAAQAYQVRPEWLNLEADEDGYPWRPEAPRKNPDAEVRAPSPSDATESQSARLDVDTLHEALTLLVHDETLAGPYSPRARTERLATLYARVHADGGRLTQEHNDQFMVEIARRRGMQWTEAVTTKRTGTQQKA